MGAAGATGALRTPRLCHGDTSVDGASVKSGGAPYVLPQPRPRPYVFPRPTIDIVEAAQKSKRIRSLLNEPSPLKGRS